MDIENAIKTLVKETVMEVLAHAPSVEPDLITVEQVADICDCDKSVIHALVHDAEANGFPVVRLGKKTLRVDRQRLNLWMRSGGLNGSDQKDSRA